MSPPRTAGARPFAAARTWLLLLALALVFDRLFALYGIDDAWFAQNNHNQRFLETGSLLTALSEYRPTWPPLYPSLLWGWTWLGLAPERMNELLGVLSILLVARLAGRCARGVDVFWPACAWTVLGAHALIARQLVAEELFVVLLLLGLHAALAQRRTGSARHAGALGLVCAAVGLTRYFGALWLWVPAGLWILADRARPLRRRVAHAALFSLCALGPVLPWVGHVWRTTGHPTGIDRFDRSPTGRMAGQLHLVTPRANAEALAETLYLDFLSASSYAKARRDTYVPGAADALAVAGVVLGAAAWLWLLARRCRSGRSAGALPAGGRPLWLLVAWFLVLVLVLWSVGNNDPLNTRFLVPVYPLLVLGAFQVYGAWKTDATRLERLPFQALFVLVLALNAWRHWAHA